MPIQGHSIGPLLKLVWCTVVKYACSELQVCPPTPPPLVGYCVYGLGVLAVGAPCPTAVSCMLLTATATAALPPALPQRTHICGASFPLLLQASVSATSTSSSRAFRGESEIPTSSSASSSPPLPPSVDMPLPLPLPPLWHPCSMSACQSTAARASRA